MNGNTENKCYTQSLQFGNIFWIFGASHHVEGAPDTAHYLAHDLKTTIWHQRKEKLISGPNFPNGFLDIDFRRAF